MEGFLSKAKIGSLLQSLVVATSILLAANQVFFAQDKPVLKRAEDKFRVNEAVELKHSSKLIGREMPYRIIYPYGYGEKRNSTKRYPVVYLLHGLWGHFDNWSGKTKIAQYSIEYEYIIVMPEGGDGWYIDSPIVKNSNYESYIVKELIPEIDGRFRTLADRDHRFVAGLSMGGYGSIKFGLKYPEMFSIAGSFSGALAAATDTEKNMAAIGKKIDIVFGPPDSEIRNENDIFRMVRELAPEKVKALPFFYLDCGTDDIFYQNNRDFTELLRKQKVSHEYRQMPGGHNWTFWDMQVKEFLRVVNQRAE